MKLTDIEAAVDEPAVLELYNVVVGYAPPIVQVALALRLLQPYFPCVHADDSLDAAGTPGGDVHYILVAPDEATYAQYVHVRPRRKTH